MQVQALTPERGFQRGPKLQTLQLVTSHRATTQIARCLAQGNMPALHTLDIYQVKLSLEAAAGLAKAHLPKLCTLRISNNVLTFPALQQLAKGQWPDLRLLDISRSERLTTCTDYMEPQDMAMDPLAGSNWPLLEKLSANRWRHIRVCSSDGLCRWPKLKSLAASFVVVKQAPILAHLQSIILLDVGHLDCLPAVAAMQLPELQELVITLSGKPASYLDMSRLINEGTWPFLETLPLPGQMLGLQSMVPLLQVDWGLIQDINLSVNCLTSEDVRVMAACEWPFLRDLKLFFNRFDEDAIAHLATGHWPELEFLDLAHSYLDDACIQHLVQGQWPLLQHLDLSVNALDCDALPILLQGRWPKLKLLYLDNCYNDDLSCEDGVAVCDDTDRIENCLVAYLLLSKSEEYRRAAAIGCTDLVQINMDQDGFEFDDDWSDSGCDCED